jgi:hypothetical protein
MLRPIRAPLGVVHSWVTREAKGRPHRGHTGGLCCDNGVGENETMLPIHVQLQNSTLRGIKRLHVPLEMSATGVIRPLQSRRNPARRESAYTGQRGVGIYRPLRSRRNPATSGAEGVSKLCSPTRYLPGFFAQEKAPWVARRIEMFQYRQVLVRLRAG